MKKQKYFERTLAYNSEASEKQFYKLLDDGWKVVLAIPVQASISCSPYTSAIHYVLEKDVADSHDIGYFVLFRALKNGIFVKPKYKDGDLKAGAISFLKPCTLSICSSSSITYRKYSNGEDFVDFPFDEYGVTWALTKEELL